MQYAILPQLFTPSEIATLRKVVDSCYNQFTAEATCDTEPGGFGPDSDGSWIILHLNHPKYHQGRQSHLYALFSSVLYQRHVAWLP